MLTIINSPRKPRRFLTYDLEWEPGTLKLRLVGVYDGERYRYYKTVDDFLACELTHSTRGAWFYAHAGGLADLNFILEAIINRHESNCFDVRASFSGSSAIIAHIRQGKNSWHFVDSYWLFRDSLASIGRSIGRHKTGPKALDGASAEDIKEWYRSAPLSELVPYNKNDCQILWEGIDRFENAVFELGGQLQMTIASTAMQLFRRVYLSRDIPTNRAINEIARQSYFASRVEVFQSRCEEALYYDVNSSFPHSMTFPAPGEHKRSGKRLPDNPEALYLADVTFTIPDCYMPPIPTRIEGRLFFPVGRWRSWLTGIDIELLQREGGHLERVHEVIEFEPFEDLKNYALSLYEKRRACSDPFDKLVYKYLLNSCYGKFGERREKDKLVIFPDLELWDRWKTAYSREKIESMRLAPGIYIETVDVEIQHEHVPVASYITARSRKLLYDYMSEAPDNYYCDTDGFCTTSEHDTSDKLGALKLEKRLESGVFVAPKVYRLDALTLDKSGQWQPEVMTKAKGFSLGRGEEASEKFDTLLEGRQIEVERMARIRETITGHGPFVPWEAKVRKRFREELLTKRFHYPDGQTRPWSIEELEKK